MSTLPKVLIILAGLAFLLAVFSSMFWGVFGIPAESFSRASNNLGIIAIALLLMGKWRSERT